ncbi:PH domain-containing protein [Actinomyces sp. 2119]|uniref:PH domain-containing protein n=1 Tax=Actinomyces lilanjuaniae TaxID=2321394 RepID=A0ABM6Z5E6_9ACTO|nr:MULTISPECIES: PH domain-containing protein [Actinomyces]AYD90558.1 PH domain-containing protein [Actinomyces lilanjuaniae]RJF43990.1 PH domain-containing protein [Actinomyces sp. 2119]
MALSKKLLSRDEVVVRHMRTHVKVLLWRVLLEVVVLVAAVAGSVLAPQSWRPWGLVALWALAAVVSLPLLLLPWLRWYTDTYTITTRRVITRSGILRRTGHDLPLSRISDVQQDKDLNDRFFGCGTLILQTSSDDPLLLRDVPHVEAVQVEIANLLFNDVQGAVQGAADLAPRR